MTIHAPVRLLVNPAAGRGRALRRLEAARHALVRVGPFDIVRTRAPGDEAVLARTAAADGVRTLVVLGGDGTISRVAAALVDVPAPPLLAILAAGTGNDLGKSLGAPVSDFERMADLIAAGGERRIDVGDVNGLVFVNAMGVGFDVSVLERTVRARWLRGDALYATTALGQLFRYRGFLADLDARDADAAGTRPSAGVSGTTEAGESARRWLTIVVANGQWFGGAFRIAPAAALDDARLDVVAVPDMAPLQRARLFGGAPWGRHVRNPVVVHETRASVRLTFPSPPLFQADGELHQAASATLDITVRAAALRVVV